MVDFVILICAKNTLSILRKDVLLGVTLEHAKAYKYNPQTEDIYIYLVSVPYKAIFATGPFNGN